MTPLDNPALPKGSTILVTGANGYLGSHVADSALQFGYKVRAAVRNPDKSSWLVEYAEKKYGKGVLDLTKVADMAVEGAYDEAVKGVSAVIHTASVMTQDYDPNNVVTAAIGGAVNALKAAYSEPSVKRFIFTSSSSAVVISLRGVPGVTITEDTWNEEAVKLAWEGPPYNPERGFITYAASKTQAEQEVWKFHRENSHKRPDLVVNTVLPNYLFGKVLDPVHQGYPTTSAMVSLLWQGEIVDFHHVVHRQYFVDVQDAARLHVAAALLPHIENQRIFAFAQRFSWDSILDIMRKRDPSRKLPADFSGGEDPNEILPREAAERLLQELGFPGWTSLEDSIHKNLEGL